MWRYGQPDTAVYVDDSAGYWRHYFRLWWWFNRVAFANVERVTVETLGAEVVAASWEEMIAKHRRGQL